MKDAESGSELQTWIVDFACRADLEQDNHLIDHIDERQRFERVSDVTDGQLLEVANQFVGATDVGVDEIKAFPDIGELCGGGSVARGR